MFEVDKIYTRNDIYKILSVPKEKQKGTWNTGYIKYDEDIYIFANIGVPGRTGSDYNNYWDGDLFHWDAKANSNINQPFIQKMIADNPSYDIHLFTRIDNSLPFTYEGSVIVNNIQKQVPVKIIWSVRAANYLNDISTTTNIQESKELYEGRQYQVILNKHERNPLARRLCIEHYGYLCQICRFDFRLIYGELGEDFIHVHHIVPLSKIDKNYKIDPIEDLILWVQIVIQ